MATNNMKYPWVAPDYQKKTGGSNIAVDVTNARTVVDVDQVTDAITISINSVESELVDGGAELVFILRQDSAAGDDVTLGSGIKGQTITGVADDVDVVHAILDKNGDFIVTSIEKAVDAA